MWNLLELINSIIDEKGLKLIDAEAIYVRNGSEYDINATNSKLSYGEAVELFDYEFEDGCGIETAHTILIYFKEWILIKSIYDGSENFHLVPRNPNDSFAPESYGG
jgi:hypothetical protein